MRTQIDNDVRVAYMLRTLDEIYESFCIPNLALDNGTMNQAFSSDAWFISYDKDPGAGFPNWMKLTTLSPDGELIYIKYDYFTTDSLHIAIGQQSGSITKFSRHIETAYITSAEIKPLLERAAASIGLYLVWDGVPTGWKTGDVIKVQYRTNF